MAADLRAIAMAYRSQADVLKRKKKAEEKGPLIGLLVAKAEERKFYL